MSSPDDPLRSVGSEADAARGAHCTASTKNVEPQPMDYFPSKGNGLMASSSDMVPAGTSSFVEFSSRGQ